VLRGRVTHIWIHRIIRRPVTNGGRSFMGGTPALLVHTGARFWGFLSFGFNVQWGYRKWRRHRLVSINFSVEQPLMWCERFQVLTNRRISSCHRESSPWLCSRPVETSTHFYYVLVWGDLGLDGWIILGWISRRWDVGILTGLGWTRIETGGGHLWVR